MAPLYSRAARRADARSFRVPTLDLVRLNAADLEDSVRASLRAGGARQRSSRPLAAPLARPLRVRSVPPRASCGPITSAATASSVRVPPAVETP